MIALHAEYRRQGDALTSIGLDGAMFDIELPKAKPAPDFVNDKARINHVVDNYLIDKAGGCTRLVLLLQIADLSCGGGKAGSNVGEEGKDGGSDDKSNQSNDAQLQGSKGSC